MRSQKLPNIVTAWDVKESPSCPFQQMPNSYWEHSLSVWALSLLLKKKSNQGRVSLLREQLLSNLNDKSFRRGLMSSLANKLHAATDNSSIWFQETIWFLSYFVGQIPWAAYRCTRHPGPSQTNPKLYGWSIDLALADELYFQEHC